MAGSLNSKPPNPKTLDAHNQESGHCCHPLCQIYSAQGNGRTAKRKFRLSEICLEIFLPPSHIPTCALETIDLGAGLARHKTENNYIPSLSLSGSVCNMGMIMCPYSITEY